MIKKNRKKGWYKNKGEGDLSKRDGIRHFSLRNQRIIFVKIKMHNKIVQISKISKKKVYFSYAHINET